MNPQILLLAGGQSSRVWPLSEKIFFKFSGKTVLQHQIEILQKTVSSDICVVGNPHNIEKIKEICTNIPGNFSFGIQKNPNGIHFGILSAEENTNLEKPLLIVCSNDMVEKKAFQNILSTAKKSDSEIFLCGKKVENYFPGGYLEIKGGKYVNRIIEKPEPGNEPSHLVTIMVHLYKKPQKLFVKLKKHQETHEYEEIMQMLFDSGIQTEAVEYDGFWQAIKYPWHILDLTEYFLSSLTDSYIHPNAQIAKNVSLQGNIVIEEGVKIFDFAVINGPAYIGKNSIVANHALIRQSIIGEECVIGHSTEIARSYLRDKCWTHQNFVGDSVFDSNVSLGAGTRTGNLRLDEGEISSFIKGGKVNTERTKLGAIIGADCRIGINTSIMPGVKIGKENFLGAGLVCDVDISEKKFTFQKSLLESYKNKKSVSKRELF